MPRRLPWIIIVSLCLYRCLLRLGTDEFYDTYAEQALQVFRQCCLSAYARQGRLGVLRLWPAMLSDTLKGMLAEQFLALKHVLRPRSGWPVALALFCVLFPFFWLSNVWPLFGSLFRLIFATPLAYFAGHVLLFCTAGLSILLCVPALFRHLRCYMLFLMLAAFTEEFIQTLFNSHPGIHKDMRNPLLDLGGILLAYLLLRLWQSWRSPSNPCKPGTSLE